MRIMSAVHPTDNQKRVLAKLMAAPTPAVGAQAVSGDANLIAARNMLMKMGLITFANGEATVTDRGMQVASDENVIDQSGELTPAGQELAFTNSRGQADQDQAGGSPPPDPAAPPRMESFSLLKQLLR